MSDSEICNAKYGIAERNYLSLRCIKLQIFSVLAWVWEVCGSIPGLFKLDTLSPTARDGHLSAIIFYRLSLSLKIVLIYRLPITLL